MKFNSLLPFDSKQIKLLETNCICCKCPLSHKNNGLGISCVELLGTKQPCNCQDNREQALQLSKTKLNMKNEILSQEECTMQVLKKSHSALLKRIAELKSGMEHKAADWKEQEQWYNEELESRDATIDECTKQIATLEKIVDNLSVQIDRRDMDWHSERKGFTERIAELEKQLKDAKELADYNSEFQIEVQDIIYNLESRLEAYESKELSEKEKAINNTFADVLFWIKNASPGQISAPIIHNSNDGYFQCTLNGKKHYYTKIDTQEEAKMKLNEKINDFVNRQIDFEVQYKEGEIFIAAQDWPDNQIKPESFIFKYEIE